MSWINGAVLTVRRSNAPLIRCSKFTRVAGEAKEIMAAALASGAAGYRTLPCQKQHCKDTADPGESYCAYHLGRKNKPLEKRFSGTCKQCGEAFESAREDAIFCSKKCVSTWHSHNRTQVKKTCVKCGRWFAMSRPRLHCYRCKPKSKCRHPPKVGNAPQPAT